jgi:hypothetical protein
MFDTIIGDTSMPNGKTYKIMKETYSDMPGSSYYYLFRNEDTVLYMYTGDTLQCPNREYIEYNFASADSNLWPICHTSLGAEYKSCYKTFYSYQPVFNSTMETKLYYYVAIRNLDTIWSVLGTSIIWVTKNVGISSSLYEAGGYYVLYGAILNGKKYGNIVGIKDKLIEPQYYNLSQNYPNPFNPSTVISYSIPSASNVKLIVFNALGQKVKTLVSGYKNAGNYTINFNASDLPSGIYFYKLEAGQFTQAKKMIFMK